MQYKSLWSKSLYPSEVIIVGCHQSTAISESIRLIVAKEQPYAMPGLIIRSLKVGMLGTATTTQLTVTIQS
jgi:hypothetical protein